MTIKRWLCSLTLSGLAFAPLLVQAAATPGDLVKASGPAVYYYAPDGKRYVFPTEKTYFTWYTDFASVRTITDAELAAMPIGGSVTYRPGSRMIKVMTDPRVYAVDAGGTLRHIASETVASSLYGANWATKVDDLSDAFFVNYRLGEPIDSSDDFDPTSRTAAATSIAVDRGLTQPAPTPEPTPEPTPTPTPTSTNTGILTASKTSVAVNEPVDFLAYANPSASISMIRVYFDGALLTECTFSPCATSTLIPSTKEMYEATAVFQWMTGEQATSTVPITVVSGAQAGVAISVTHAEVKPEGVVEIVVSSDNSFIAYTIDIVIDGQVVKGCGDIQECRYLGTEGAAVGTEHATYGVLRDRSGGTRTTEVKRYRVVSNPRPEVQVTLGKNAIFAGETVDATVTASDDGNLAGTEVWLNGTRVKSCLTVSCTAVIGPITNPGTYYVVGRATDDAGLTGSATSSALIVQ